MFEIIRLDMKEGVGAYMAAMMNAEPNHFLGDSHLFGLLRQQIVVMVPMAGVLPLRGSGKSMFIFLGIVTVNSRSRLFLVPIIQYFLITIIISRLNELRPKNLVLLGYSK